MLPVGSHSYAHVAMHLFGLVLVVYMKHFCMMLSLCTFHIIAVIADATISLIPPTAPISEAAGEVLMCCARLTNLPTGGLGCPLVADLILMNGSKAGVLFFKGRCMDASADGV